jgi:hypothetical protein
MAKHRFGWVVPQGGVYDAAGNHARRVASKMRLLAMGDAATMPVGAG